MAFMVYDLAIFMTSKLQNWKKVTEWNSRNDDDTTDSLSESVVNNLSYFQFIHFKELRDNS